MKLPLRSIPWLALALSLMLLTGCRSRWQQQGRAEARHDLAAGKLCIKIYSRPAPLEKKYYALAHQRLGIEHLVFAGSTVDEEMIERAEAYNKCMMEEINRRFGPDALSQLRTEILKEHQQEQVAGRGPGG